MDDYEYIREVLLEEGFSKEDIEKIIKILDNTCHFCLAASIPCYCNRDD